MTSYMLTALRASALPRGPVTVSFTNLTPQEAQEWAFARHAAGELQDTNLAGGLPFYPTYRVPDAPSRHPVLERGSTHLLQHQDMAFTPPEWMLVTIAS